MKHIYIDGATPASSVLLRRGPLDSRLFSGGESESVSVSMASSPAAVRELQQDLESQANALSKIQKDIAKNHQVRKQYTIQLGENELVLTELELLNENSNVYKLIGPVLVKQDIAEANANVRKRIEYISVELKRLDGTLQDSEDKQNSKKESVLQLQQKIQTLQAGKSKS
nr:PREDICTED: prefoldin subunit 6-like [Musa acuminata subsp. malaccensis]